MQLRTWSGAVLFVCLLLTASSASAALVSLTNPSFENPSPPFVSSCGTGCTFNVGSFTGWTVSGSGGQFQPSSALFNSLPNGSVLAYSNGGTITQNVGTISSAGIVYTLMVDIGLRNDLSGNVGSIQLLIGGTPINGTGAAPTSGNFSTFTASYTTSAANVGQNIAIQLSSSGAQGDFDNVRLDATAAPEPATVSLMLFGLAGFGVAARLRRRA